MTVDDCFTSFFGEFGGDVEVDVELFGVESVSWFGLVSDGGGGVTFVIDG